MVLLVLFILVCVLWTKPHSLEAYQNGALPLNGYFQEAESFLFFFFSLNYLGSMPSMPVGAPFESSSMLCTYPTNHKIIKTEHSGYSETHYAFLFKPLPSVLPSLERTSSPLWTPLPPLWVFAFTGKTQITSHALWSVGVVILFSMWLFINLWFSLICLCSMFVRFFFFSVFSMTL